MKKLFVLLMVGMCSQDFCMNPEAVSNGENVLGMNSTMDDMQFVTNAFLRYCTNHEQDAPIVESPQQVLLDASRCLSNCIEFDRANMDGKAIDVEAVMAECPLDHSMFDDDELTGLIGQLRRNLYNIENEINDIHRSLYAMPLGFVSNMYTKSLANVRFHYDALYYLVNFVDADQYPIEVRSRAINVLDIIIKSYGRYMVEMGRNIKSRNPAAESDQCSVC